MILMYIPAMFSAFLGRTARERALLYECSLHLFPPQAEILKIFDKPLYKNRSAILTKVGAIVEKPDFYGYLSAYKNLEILAKISGNNVAKKHIMETLELVGLDKRYNSKVKTFSHGMKQRLGLAQALIHDPELIILDEPTTGLDPQGMKEIRDLIVFLSKEKGKTIFLSSHILYEVELVSNRMIIINKGKTVVEGLVKDLLNSTSLKVTYEVDDAAKALSVIELTGWKEKLSTAVNERLIFNLEKNEISLLNRQLIENGVEVSAVVPTRSLEEYFLNLTDKGAQMITLVGVELYKIFRKWRTYIGFIAIGVLVSIIQIALYFEGEGYLDAVTRGISQSFIFTGNLLNGYLIAHLILGALVIHIPFLITLVARRFACRRSYKRDVQDFGYTAFITF